MGVGRKGWGMAYTPVVSTDAAASMQTRCDLVDISKEIDGRLSCIEASHSGNCRS